MPPFRHGFSWHSSMSISHCVPVKPVTAHNSVHIATILQYILLPYCSTCCYHTSVKIATISKETIVTLKWIQVLQLHHLHRVLMLSDNYCHFLPKVSLLHCKATLLQSVSKQEGASDSSHLNYWSYTRSQFPHGAWVSIVVKALRYSSDSHGINSQWCHWIFQWHIPSDCTMALGLTQPLVKMSTRNISWG
jgi:hypothetical protein